MERLYWKLSEPRPSTPASAVAVPGKGQISIKILKRPKKARVGSNCHGHHVACRPRHAGHGSRVRIVRGKGGREREREASALRYRSGADRRPPPHPHPPSVRIGQIIACGRRDRFFWPAVANVEQRITITVSTGIGTNS